MGAILLSLVATSCQPIPQATDQDSTAPPDTSPLPSAAAPQCVGQLVIQNPGSPPQDPGASTGQALSSQQLADYLRIMGIASFCVPYAFGRPTLNVDWNDLADPPIAIGRMISIGFDGLEEGAYGWGRSFILYSTYDFEVGSEYEVFATLDDLQSARDHVMPRMVVVDGADGFIRYTPGLSMGVQPVYLTYVFPFETHYLAAVLSLGMYDPSAVSEIVLQMETGQHPDLANPDVALFNELVSSLRFQ